MWADVPTLTDQTPACGLEACPRATASAPEEPVENAVAKPLWLLIPDVMRIRVVPAVPGELKHVPSLN